MVVAIKRYRASLLLALSSTTFGVSSFTFSTAASFAIRNQLRISSSSAFFSSQAPAGKEIIMSESQLVVSLRDHLLGMNDETAKSDDDRASQKKIHLILASQSPRRREILDMMGLQNRYRVTPSPLDESLLQQQLRDVDPVVYTRTLALEKAMALAETLASTFSEPQLQPTTTLILGSDTIVAYDGHILEKPVDEADAVRMLETLQGNRHSVHTGVALVKVQQRHPHQQDEGNDVMVVEAFTDTAQVTFATLSTNDIASYVATGEPMDKAGSYGIQGIGGQLVTSIEGDFFTVSLVSG